MKIELRPFQQKKPSTCLPACLRIVLDYFGMKTSEAELAEACRTNQRGTKLKDAATAMRSQGYDVIELKEADLFELVDYLEQGAPIIAAVDAGQLSYGGAGTHAVVIHALEKNRVHYIEPALGRSIVIDLITFFKAWDSFSCSGLVIYPKPKSKTRKKKR
jgi:ABC-type bacteriocin/lantibiotic exporter with double-glycine peptidase domain